MSEAELAADDIASSGNSALDWEIFDILCKDELGLKVRKYHTQRGSHYLNFQSRAKISLTKCSLSIFRIFLGICYFFWVITRTNIVYRFVDIHLQL